MLPRPNSFRAGAPPCSLTLAIRWESLASTRDCVFAAPLPPRLSGGLLCRTLRLRRGSRLGLSGRGLPGGGLLLRRRLLGSRLLLRRSLFCSLSGLCLRRSRRFPLSLRRRLCCRGWSSLCALRRSLLLPCRFRWLCRGPRIRDSRRNRRHRRRPVSEQQALHIPHVLRIVIALPPALRTRTARAQHQRRDRRRLAHRCAEVIMIHQPDGFGGEQPGDSRIVNCQQVVAILRFASLCQVGRPGKHDGVRVVEIDNDELVVDHLSLTARELLVERRGHLFDQCSERDELSRLSWLVERESGGGLSHAVRKDLAAEVQLLQSLQCFAAASEFHDGEHYGRLRVLESVDNRLHRHRRLGMGSKTNLKVRNSASCVGELEPLRSQWRFDIAAHV